MRKKKVLLKGPLLTRSGYGEQARFALRALRSNPDSCEIFIQPMVWGQTSWVSVQDEERLWIDQTIEKTIAYLQQGGTFDISVQVTIPNEWEKLAPVNIGYTAGIETTKVAHEWLLKANEVVDKIIVVSTHSKNVFERTEYTGRDERTNQEVQLTLQKPVHAVNYPVKNYDSLPELDLELKHETNFVSVAQFGPRKNVPNTLKWFMEEFKDDDVGFVLKTNIAKNCLMDREKVVSDLKQFLSPYGDHKCKVYVLHGNMTDEEMHSLYRHPKIKAYVTMAHGEGFGLPVFEAAYSGLPVVSPGWSGQMDFLCDSKGKERFYNAPYDIQTVSPDVVWPGVLVADSMWAHPREEGSKKKMRQCYEDVQNNAGHAATSCEYATELTSRFEESKMYNQFISHVLPIEEMKQEAQDIDDLLSDLL